MVRQEELLRSLLDQKQSALIEGTSGSGKSHVLRALQRDGPPSTLLDCSVLAAEYPGDAERDVLRAFNTGARLVILDNVDCLFFDDEVGEESQMSTVLASALDELAENGGFAVASCTSSSSLPASLLLARRLGSPIVMHLPSAPERRALFESLLTDPRIEVSNTGGGSVSELCEELSLRTQGCSIGDSLLLVRCCLHAALIEEGEGEKGNREERVRLTSEALLSETANLRPSAAQFNALLVPAPATQPCVLLGLEQEQARLERAILGSIHGSGSSQLHTQSRPCRGVLIHGPAGTGKSSLAAWAAFATRTRFRQLVVPCADLVHKVVGESERRVAECFRAARQMAPCLLLLDNLEIILGGDKGGGMRGRRTAHIALDRLLSTLLIEIDGLASVEETGVGSDPPAAPVIVIATTTDISALDKALIRPGRLEEHISLQHPSLQQRTDLVSHLVARFDLSLFSGPPSHQGVSAVVERLATATQGRSQAEIVSLVQEASFRALSAKIRSSSQDQGGGAVELSLQDCFFPHT